jgi:hypothetical protein
MQNALDAANTRMKKDLGKLRPSEQVRLVVERPTRYALLKQKVESAGGNIYDYETKMLLVAHNNIPEVLDAILSAAGQNPDSNRREQLDTLVLRALNKAPETLLMLKDKHPSYIPDTIPRVLSLYRTPTEELSAQEARRLSEERDAVVYAAHARREFAFWERFFKGAAASPKFTLPVRNVFMRAYQDFAKRDASGVTTFTGDRGNTRSYTKIQNVLPDGTVKTSRIKYRTPSRPKARFGY